MDIRGLQIFLMHTVTARDSSFSRMPLHFLQGSDAHEGLIFRLLLPEAVLTIAALTFLIRLSSKATGYTLTTAALAGIMQSQDPYRWAVDQNVMNLLG